MSKSISHLLNKILYNYSNKKYFNKYNEYFTNKSQIKKEEYLKIFEISKKLTSPKINSYLQSKENIINEHFLQELALITQITVKKSEVQYFHGKLLYSLISNDLKKRNLNYLNILEIGTARGFSSLCMAKALDDFKLKGNIISLDLLPHNKKIYWGSISDKDGKQTRRDLLKNYIELLNYITFIQSQSPNDLFRFGMNNINLCFIDGAHTYSSVIKESRFVANFQSKDDLIFFDDYNKRLFPGCVKAVDEFCFINKYEKQVIDGYQGRNFVIAKKN